MNGSDFIIAGDNCEEVFAVARPLLEEAGYDTQLDGYKQEVATICVFAQTDAVGEYDDDMEYFPALVNLLVPAYCPGDPSSFVEAPPSTVVFATGDPFEQLPSLVWIDQNFHEISAAVRSADSDVCLRLDAERLNAFPDYYDGLDRLTADSSTEVVVWETHSYTQQALASCVVGSDNAAEDLDLAEQGLEALRNAR